MKFEKVVTLCSICKEKIVVEAEYKDRNKKYRCDKCE
jgi:hypothetical protein